MYREFKVYCQLVISWLIDYCRCSLANIKIRTASPVIGLDEMGYGRALGEPFYLDALPYMWLLENRYC